jgi:integrase
METIIRNNCIKTNRQPLAESTIKNYITCLNTISKAIYEPLETQNDICNHYDQIIQYLMVLKTTSRKTKLAALAVALKGSPNLEVIGKFNTQRIKDSNEIKEREKKQIQPKSVIKNFIPWERIMQRYEELRKITKPLWALEQINRSQFFQLQDFVILSCYVLIEPRRAEDFCQFKIRNFNVNTDNYLIYNKRFANSWLVFNKYKMSYKFGQKRIELPPNLKKILIDWCKKNPYDYLFVNTKYRQCAGSRIYYFLDAIFDIAKDADKDQHIGPNVLRHAWATHLYQDINGEQLQNSAANMGSGEISRVLAYVVKDEQLNPPVIYESDMDDSVPESEGDTVTVISEADEEDSEIEIEFTPDDLQS